MDSSCCSCKLTPRAAAYSFLFDAVDSIKNHAYVLAGWGYIGSMDQHAHPEHEGMLRNYTFNDVLMEGHGVYTGVLQALLSVEPGGGASVMSADGAVTDVTFRRVTVRNWVAYDMPAVGFLSTLDRPMTLSIDTFAIENCRGVAGSPRQSHQGQRTALTPLPALARWQTRSRLYSGKAMRTSKTRYFPGKAT